MEDYLIVNKSFTSGNTELTVGEPVDASSWRNRRSLLEAGYLRKPNKVEDWEAIQEIKREDAKEY